MLCDVVTRWARHAPDHVAVADGAATVTYRELDRRTDGLAAALRAEGVGPGHVVALVVDRGLEHVEAVLAVWKAGAAFLPLSDSYPRDWSLALAERAGVTAVLAGTAVGRLPGLPHLDLARLDAVPGAGDLPRPAPEDLAYVMPTSGTTAEPKLVLVEHAGVRNLVDVQREHFPDLGPGARVLQFASPAFDGAVFDLVMALGHGARLEVPPREVVAGDDLATTLLDRRVSHAVLPAAVVRTLPDQPYPDLRVLVSVGEVCSPSTAERWRDRVAFVNGYGPTETTVCATLHTVTAADPAAPEVPIGRAVAGTTALVVDEHLRPVADGEVGEIVLGGPHVGRGYLGDAALTARRFVANPFGAGRLYLTGDLGRRSPDGVLTFLGRGDDQLKVRGVRVEPGAVEHALTALPPVREAVVSGRSTTEGTTRLVAHVVLDDGPPVTGTAIRVALAGEVPRHLVPDEVHVLPRLPLTANGKVDRSRLPVPVTDDIARTTTEQALSRILEGLLGVDGVGVHEHILDLGGHSLIATQLVARSRAAFGGVVDLKLVLGRGTVAAIAEAVDRARAT
ncbi:amino acid adenylation domain-containing protein [Umezawaea endophytica]|uniref:Non-ribosomal peptide synthetase n=1 Tax=Umezawaea endophytica TaxID=1654476 RepID=A0A9X2VTA7_9PSEU|nr:non-ribosomal peptide synthetase [Umezawaea endophytica]MCS7482433.1 non-ribosomal peptide synthetase [Umezawaea endophytica]